MGSVTITSPAYGPIPQNLGQKYMVFGYDVTLSNSYAAGGDTITPQQIGFGSVIDAMIVMTGKSPQTTFWLYLLNVANAPIYTIQAFTAASSTGGADALVEVTASTDLSVVTFAAAFIGV